MPKVVVACGSGVATSQVVADKVRKMLAARGVDADVVAVEVADLPKALEDADAYVAVVTAEGEDYEDAGDQWIVYTAYDKMNDVVKGLEDQGIEVKGSELTMVPTTPTDVSVVDAKKVQRLVDRLDELEDVQNVYHTMNVTDEIAAALEEDE